jgi:2-keto-3-deoxy-L-rhamnonate aldolase RhmA
MPDNHLIPLTPSERDAIESIDYLDEAAERIMQLRGIERREAMALVDAAWEVEVNRG